MIGRCGTLRSVAREEGSIQQYASVCRPRDSGVGGVSMILRARPSPPLALCLLLLAMLLSCFPARQVARARFDSGINYSRLVDEIRAVGMNHAL